MALSVPSTFPITFHSLLQTTNSAADEFTSHVPRVVKIPHSLLLFQGFCTLYALYVHFFTLSTLPNLYLMIEVICPHIL